MSWCIAHAARVFRENRRLLRTRITSPVAVLESTVVRTSVTGVEASSKRCCVGSRRWAGLSVAAARPSEFSDWRWWRQQSKSSRSRTQRSRSITAGLRDGSREAMGQSSREPAKLRDGRIRARRLYTRPIEYVADSGPARRRRWRISCTCLGDVTHRELRPGHSQLPNRRCPLAPAWWYSGPRH